jgi:hypothetical protein
MLILIDIFDDEQLEQREIDLDPALGDLLDDHHGKDDPQAHGYEG